MLEGIKNFIKEYKTQIFSVIVLTTAFLSLKNVIDEDTLAYINAVAAVVFWINKVATLAKWLWKKLWFSK